MLVSHVRSSPGCAGVCPADLEVDGRLPGGQDLVKSLLQPRVEVRQDVAYRAAEVLADRESIDLCQRLVQTNVAKLHVEESESDRSRIEQRVQESGRVLHVAMQLGVVDGHGSPASELPRQLEILLGVAAARLCSDKGDRPDRPTPGDEGDAHVGTHPEAAQDLQVIRVARG